MIRDDPPGVIVMNTLYRAEYGGYLELLLFVAGIGFLALGTFPLIVRTVHKRNVWLAIVALSVVAIACLLFFEEYSGWTKYFSSIESQTRAGHTSILWENILFPKCMVRLLTAREKRLDEESLRQCIRPVGGDLFSFP